MVIKEENIVEENLDVDETTEDTATVEVAPVSIPVNIPFVIGRKVGMTRIFDANGTDFPATVISAGPCIVTQIKTLENETCITGVLNDCTSILHQIDITLPGIIVIGDVVAEHSSFFEEDLQRVLHSNY